MPAPYTGKGPDDWPARKKEIDQAVAEHKRIIPVVVRDVDPQQVLPAVAALNWIFLRPTDNEQEAIQRLLFALDTDLEFWHTGSRLLLSTQQWDTKPNGRSKSAPAPAPICRITRSVGTCLERPACW